MSGRGKFAIIVVLLGVGAAVPLTQGWLRTTGDVTTAASRDAETVASLDTSAQAPVGVRLRLQVLNGTERPGLARRATQQLRDLGYDVVDYGNNRDTISVTEVHATTRHRAAGERVLKAMRVGTLIERADPLPHLDLLVVIGSDWQPSPQSFRP